MSPSLDVGPCPPAADGPDVRLAERSCLDLGDCPRPPTSDGPDVRRGEHVRAHRRRSDCPFLYDVGPRASAGDGPNAHLARRDCPSLGDGPQALAGDGPDVKNACEVG
eukprot:SAG11_NODE_416_length_9669_cov_7.135528_13_plen_108_part_00